MTGNLFDYTLHPQTSRAAVRSSGPSTRPELKNPLQFFYLNSSQHIQ